MDEDGCVKFTPTKTHKWRDIVLSLNEAPFGWRYNAKGSTTIYSQMVIVDAGRRMRKTTKGSRDALPDSVLRLSDVYSIAATNASMKRIIDHSGVSDAVESTCLQECMFCGQILQPRFADAVDGVLLRCSLCLCAHHVGRLP